MSRLYTITEHSLRYVHRAIDGLTGMPCSNQRRLQVHQLGFYSCCARTFIGIPRAA